MDGKRFVPFAPIGLFIIVAVQIGGFVLLWSKDAPLPEYVYLSATADKTAAASAAISPVVVVSPPDEKALREMIQTVLEQELSAYTRQLIAAPGTIQKVIPSNPPNVKEHSEENSIALTQINSIVSVALARGKWLPSDNIAALTYAHQLTDAQKFKIMDEVMGAVNRQELDIRESAPAF
jgi:hypothetical protein